MQRLNPNAHTQNPPPGAGGAILQVGKHLNRPKKQLPRAPQYEDQTIRNNFYSTYTNNSNFNSNERIPQEAAQPPSRLQEHPAPNQSKMSNYSNTFHITEANKRSCDPPPKKHKTNFSQIMKISVQNQQMFEQLTAEREDPETPNKPSSTANHISKQPPV